MYISNLLNIHEYIIDSFLKGNLKNFILKDVEYKDDIDIQNEQFRYKDIISKVNEFKDIFLKITDMNYDILVCNSHGFVIDMIHVGSDCCENISNIEIGMCLGQNKFAESSVSLCMSLGRPINLPPTQNRNRIFTDCYEYCLPFTRDGIIFAYLFIITKDNKNSLDTLLIDIAHYIKFNVCYKDKNSDKSAYRSDSKLLSNREIEVLTGMAKGLTEYAISKELGISRATVKFHKQIIFEKLSVNCTVQAVIKAIKANYIFLENI